MGQGNGRDAHSYDSYGTLALRPAGYRNGPGGYGNGGIAEGAGAHASP